MELNWKAWSFAACFLLTICALALRPYIPMVHRMFDGSDIGAWNMYKYLVASEEGAALISDDGIVVRFPHEDYVWHGHFISTAHPHIEQSVIERFVEFLAARPELAGLLVDHRDNPERKWKVSFRLRFRKGYQSPKLLSATRDYLF